jgi:hypothetical protein
MNYYLDRTDTRLNPSIPGGAIIQRNFFQRAGSQSVRGEIQEFGTFGQHSRKKSRSRFTSIVRAWTGTDLKPD